MADRPPQHEAPELENAARLRAAFAYKGIIGPTPIGKALGVSDSTAKRLIRGDRQENGKSRYTRELWDSVLEITAVPPWFIQHGWDGANIPDEASMAEEVQALRHQMDTVLGIIGARALAGGASAAKQPGQTESRKMRQGRIRSLESRNPIIEED